MASGVGTLSRFGVRALLLNRPASSDAQHNSLGRTRPMGYGHRGELSTKCMDSPGLLL